MNDKEITEAQDTIINAKVPTANRHYFNEGSFTLVANNEQQAEEWRKQYPGYTVVVSQLLPTPKRTQHPFATFIKGSI